MSGKGKGAKGMSNYVFDVSNQVPCKRQRLTNQQRAVVISEPSDDTVPTVPHPGLCIELDDDIDAPGDEEHVAQELQEKENAEYLASVFKALAIEVDMRDLPTSWLKSVRSSMTYLAGDEFSTPAMMLLKSCTRLESRLSKRDVLKFMSFASSCKEDYTWNSLKDVQLAQWLAYIGATTVSEQQLLLLFDEGITSPRKLVAIGDSVLRTFGLTTNDLNMYVTVTVSSFEIMIFSSQDPSGCCK